MSHIKNALLSRCRGCPYAVPRVGVFHRVVGSSKTSIQAPAATPVPHVTWRVTPQRFRSTPYRPTLSWPWVTTHARLLLSLVPGRSGAAYAGWLNSRGAGFTDG